MVLAPGQAMGLLDEGPHALDGVRVDDGREISELLLGVALPVTNPHLQRRNETWEGNLTVFLAVTSKYGIIAKSKIHL